VKYYPYYRNTECRNVKVATCLSKKEAKDFVLKYFYDYPAPLKIMKEGSEEDKRAFNEFKKDWGVA